MTPAMTPKMFWSWLGSLIFVITFLWNLMYGIPEPVLVILIGLWSLCFAATVKVDNPIRKKHWKSLEDQQIPAKGQVYATKRRPEIKPAPFPWPEGFSEWKQADKDWYIEQMRLAGVNPPPPPSHTDVGIPFPAMDVQEAREKIDRAGRQKNCKHLDKTEITEFGDRHRKFYCMICEKIIEV